MGAILIQNIIIPCSSPPLLFPSCPEWSTNGNRWIHYFFLSCGVLLLSSILPNAGTLWGFVLPSSVAQLGNSNTLPCQWSLLARFLIPVTVITPTVPLRPSGLIFRVSEIVFPDTSLSFSDFSVALLQIALYSSTLESVRVTHIVRWRVNLFYPCPRRTQSIMSFSKLALCHSLHSMSWCEWHCNNSTSSLPAPSCLAPPCDSRDKFLNSSSTSSS